MNDSTTAYSQADTTVELKLTVLGGRSILFVMAADAEYGPHLKQRFTPLITGVGPVEAAVEGQLTP
ncbi:hypothetical protein [Halomonas sp. DQ26W]|uniref:hypothetical protein n=1 Tax=Halomonas sp. DQ26W TaxID=2282311 RepID=UPI0021619399|nr:hypothetical protein [Halomonas sp. DQ26W]